MSPLTKNIIHFTILAILAALTLVARTPRRQGFYTGLLVSWIIIVAAFCDWTP